MCIFYILMLTKKKSWANISEWHRCSIVCCFVQCFPCFDQRFYLCSTHFSVIIPCDLSPESPLNRSTTRETQVEGSVVAEQNVILYCMCTVVKNKSISWTMENAFTFTPWTRWTQNPCTGLVVDNGFVLPWLWLIVQVSGPCRLNSRILPALTE